MRVWRSSSRTLPSRTEIEGQSLSFVFENLGHSTEIEGLSLDFGSGKRGQSVCAAPVFVFWLALGAFLA